MLVHGTFFFSFNKKMKVRWPHLVNKSMLAVNEYKKTQRLSFFFFPWTLKRLSMSIACREWVLCVNKCIAFFLVEKIKKHKSEEWRERKKLSFSCVLNSAVHNIPFNYLSCAMTANRSNYYASGILFRALIATL